MGGIRARIGVPAILCVVLGAGLPVFESLIVPSMLPPAQAIIPVLRTPVVSAGGSHSLAIRADGKVLAWGDNTGGQLGNSETSSTPVSTPATVAGVGGTRSWVLELAELDGHIAGLAVTALGSGRAQATEVHDVAEHARRLREISVVGDDEDAYDDCLAYVSALERVEAALGGRPKRGG